MQREKRPTAAQLVEWHWHRASTTKGDADVQVLLVTTLRGDNQDGESVNQDGVDGFREDRLRLRGGTSESSRALFGPSRRDDQSFDVEDPGKMRFNPRPFGSLPCRHALPPPSLGTSADRRRGGTDVQAGIR